MGFVNITFGFFNAATKQYDPQSFNNVELSGMQGTIARQKGKPSVHAHGIVSGRDFRAYGGHILSGTVSTGSLEVLIMPHDKAFERKYEEPPGANVLQLTPILPCERPFDHPATKCTRFTLICTTPAQ